MAQILEFPGGRILVGERPGDDCRAKALRPLWDLPKEWRCDRAELNARFDLETRIEIVRKTRDKLAKVLEKHRKLGQRQTWYYDVNAHLNAAYYLKQETAYLEELEAQQAAKARLAVQRLPALANALCDSMRGLMPAEPDAVCAQELTDEDKLDRMPRQRLMQVASDCGIRFDFSSTKAQIKHAILEAING